MKAILVAGGHGSRLLPYTRYTHKTLLPLYKRPVIDYALGTIRRAGITDITIIGNQFIGQIAQHVGTGLPGETINYVIEEEPLGVHHALNLARPHAEGSRILLYFSDNITAIELTDAVREFRESKDEPGCALVGRDVDDPERFGVAVFDENRRLVDIVEKPKDPPSSFAIGGIYLFDETFWERLDSVVAIKGRAISISDVNQTYVRDGKASIIEAENSLWIDCGTPDSLFEAAVLAEEGKISPEPCNYRDGDSTN